MSTRFMELRGAQDGPVDVAVAGAEDRVLGPQFAFLNYPKDKRVRDQSRGETGPRHVPHSPRAAYAALPCTRTRACPSGAPAASLARAFL
jgi:hypothetical protein